MSAVIRKMKRKKQVKRYRLVFVLKIINAVKIYQCALEIDFEYI